MLHRVAKILWSYTMAPCTALLLSMAGAGPASATEVTHSLEEVLVWADVGVPIEPGDLEKTFIACPEDHLANGLSYVKGRTVDSIHLHCILPEFAGTYFRTRYEGMPFWTVSAGGRGGTTPYSMECPNGMVLAGTRGINKNWQGLVHHADGNISLEHQWLMLTIAIDCAKLIRSHPWRVASYDGPGGFDTSHSRGERKHETAFNDIDSVPPGALPFVVSSDPTKNGFHHYCVDTPINGYEVAFGQWKNMLTGVWSPVVQAVKWECY